MRPVRCAIAITCLCGLGLLTPAQTTALIVQGEPMTAPAGNGVGWWRGATAVAIGPRHILSARHLGGTVGEGFILDGVPYASVKITNHPTADLALIELNADIPVWHDIAVRAKKGDSVFIGGLGRVAGTSSSGGIQWSSTRDERWGRNKLASVKGGRFTIKFDKGRKGVVNEAIFAHGDSGAGVFIEVQGELQLVGIATNVQGNEFAAYGSMGSGVDVTSLRGWISIVMAGG